MSDEQPDYPPPAPPRLEQPRNDSNHMFMSPRNQPERDAWAVERWVKDGWILKDIAAGLGIAKSAAHEAVERGLRGPRDAAQKGADQARAIHRVRLERLNDAAMEVLERKHLTVSHGKVIMVVDEGTGEQAPLLDDAPVLAAIDRLLRIGESARKLDGLDAPSRVSLEAEAIGQEVSDILNALATTAADDQPSA